jgi:hypothetical protein
MVLSLSWISESPSFAMQSLSSSESSMTVAKSTKIIQASHISAARLVSGRLSLAPTLVKPARDALLRGEHRIENSESLNS